MTKKDFITKMLKSNIGLTKETIELIEEYHTVRREEIKAHCKEYGYTFEETEDHFIYENILVKKFNRLLNTHVYGDKSIKERSKDIIINGCCFDKRDITILSDTTFCGSNKNFIFELQEVK